MKTFKRLSFLIAGICLVVACSKSDRFFNEMTVLKLNNQTSFAPGDVLNLSGRTIYNYVQVIGNNELADMFCPNTARITFLEDQKIQVFITENGDCGGRSFNAYGQMTPSGATYFEYAIPIMPGVNITDVIQGHLGCSLSGPGIDRGTIVFKGKFDGTRLVAISHFNARCPVAWAPNNIFTTPVDGPVQCSWTYDLTAD